MDLWVNAENEWSEIALVKENISYLSYKCSRHNYNASMINWIQVNYTYTLICMLSTEDSKDGGFENDFVYIKKQSL